MEESMEHLMQSLRSFYDHLSSRIAASAEKHEAEDASLRAELAKQNFKRGLGISVSTATFCPSLGSRSGL